MEPQYAFQSAPQNAQPLGLAAAAQQVQQKGRGDDSMLVHMTPDEVRGLDGLARAYGGQLSTNPNTGLPEAGFLSNILPTLIGAGLSFVPGVGPLMAAGLVGGFETLRTGNLGKGLLAGLGAWGGAGLASGLTAAGAGAAAPAATTGATASSAAPGSATAALREAISPAAFTPASATTMAPLQQASTFTGAAQQAGTGLQALGTEAGRANFMQGVGGTSGLLKTAGAAAAPMMLGDSQEAVKPTGTGTYVRPYKFTRTKKPEAFYTTPSPGAGSYERRYFDDTFTALPSQKVLDFAAGGLTALAEGGLRDGGFVIPADVVSHFGNGSNEAGQEILSRGLGAIAIKGDGDGMSDSIQTTIEGKEPARVADGEAYIPPEVVKKVGAKRLYAMMDKIRLARTGKEQQAPEIKAEQYLPA